MTSTGIQLHRESLQTILRWLVPSTPEAGDGFASTSVFALAPAKLDSAELPAVYSLTGSATYDESELGEKWEVVTRLYRVQVAVVPIGLANPEIRESKCQPLLELVTHHLSGFPTLNNTAHVKKARVLSDSGIVVLPEFAAKYVGFEIRLQVQYHQLRAFGSGE